MRLTRANNNAVRYACMHFHYAKAVPVNTIGYNVYNDANEWCGVVLFGTGACNHIGVPYNLPQGGVLELVRVALNGKQEHTSQAVALALKELKKDCPLCRLVVSYADCDQDHLGTIYQATNWIYAGHIENKNNLCYMIKGKKMHKKTVGDYTRNRYGFLSMENVKRAYNTEDVVRIDTKGKRKYLMPMDKQMRKQILPLAQPYPKTDENWQKIDRKQFEKTEK